MTIQFGDPKLIRQRRKDEAYNDFQEAFEKLLILSEIPWRSIGYIIGGVVADVAIDYDMDNGRSFEYFKAGYEAGMNGEQLQSGRAQ